MEQELILCDITTEVLVSCRTYISGHVLQQLIISSRVLNLGGCVIFPMENINTGFHKEFMFHQLRRFWVAWWLHVSYCELQLPIFMTWLPHWHCEILSTETIQRCWKIVPKSPRLTRSKVFVAVKHFVLEVVVSIVSSSDFIALLPSLQQTVCCRGHITPLLIG